MVKKNKEIMTTHDVAEYLNIHPLTVHKYAREGKIPAFKIGTDWRYHKKYIEEWIKEKLEYNVTGIDRRKSSLKQQNNTVLDKKQLKSEIPFKERRKSFLDQELAWDNVKERKERRKTVLKGELDSA